MIKKSLKIDSIKTDSCKTHTKNVYVWERGKFYEHNFVFYCT